MRKFLFLFASLLPVAMAAQSGRYELQTMDFNKLNVVDGVNVDYVQSRDSAGYVVFHADREMASQLIFENTKGTLKVRTKFSNQDSNTPRLGLPSVTVYSTFLVEVKNSGDSAVRVLKVLQAPEFKATVVGNGSIAVKDITCNKFSASIRTGNGTIVATGRCDEASLSNTGVGTIQADGLEARDASCKFIGKGTTGVWATEKLVVKGTPSAKLYYRGNPVVKDYSLGVKVERLDPAGPQPAKLEEADEDL